MVAGAGARCGRLRHGFHTGRVAGRWLGEQASRPKVFFFSIRRCCNRVRANADAPRNDPETINKEMISHAEHRLLKLWRKEETQTGDSSNKIVRDSKSVKFAADSCRLWCLFDGHFIKPHAVNFGSIRLGCAEHPGCGR